MLASNEANLSMIHKVTIGAEVASGTSNGAVRCEDVGAETITEISDKDYRSLHLPCDPLEPRPVQSGQSPTLAVERWVPALPTRR
jgi:hypothetical protein